MGKGNRMTERNPPAIDKLHVVPMGVSGSGKSLIGHTLAEILGAHFLDGDDLHPASNIEKMATGQAITDADRGPRLRQVGLRLASAEGPLVIACSALKRSYRDTMDYRARADRSPAQWTTPNMESLTLS